MPKVQQLTHAFCLTAQCQPGKARTDYYCQSCIGFCLECRSSGFKTYTFRFQNEYGKLTQRRIAPYGDITFAAAQKIARQWRAEVVTGGDPAARKAEKKSVPTYADLAKQHLEFAQAHLRRPENVERVLRVHILPRWKAERVDAIKAQDVEKWLNEKRKGGLAPATVEKIRICFNRSFELALRWGLAGIKHNPVRAIPRHKFNNAKERYLSSEEAARLMEAAGQSLNPQLKNIVGLLLLTGARKRELLDARWEHIDRERKAWFLPDTKNGTSRWVPLSQAALDIIDELPRFDKCPWLLPNPASKAKTPYTDLKHPFDTARKLAGLPDVTIHTLRHSAASFMANAGIDIFAVGKVLGHKSIASTQRYSHLANDTLLKAVEAGAAKMNINWAGAVSAE